MSEDTSSSAEKLADEILRQVVCDCGNYRHHGVGWMPDGSGEGKSVAIKLIMGAFASVRQHSSPAPAYLISGLMFGIIIGISLCR